jgi:hypothetical protein
MATNVSTINHSGEDYSTIALWEADTDTDLVTAGDIEALEVYADDGAISQGNVTIAGATTNASSYRVIRAKSGDEWGGDLTPSGVATIAVTATNAIKLNENYLRIEDIFFDTPTSNSRFPVQINNDNCVVARCFFDDGSGPNVAGDNNTVTRCVMLNSEDTIDITGSGNTLSNCTMYGGTYGVYVTSANTTVYNNVSDNHSYHDSYLDGSGSWHSNSAGNMSGGVDFGGPMPGLDNVGITVNTSPGAGNWFIVNNVSSGSEDFQLVDDADNDAIGYGETLTALESVDAFGNSANTNWDVGAFNLASAATTYTKTVTANGILEASQTTTTSANGLLQTQDTSLSSTANALLELQDITVTVSTNGFLNLALFVTIGGDGILKLQDVTLTSSGDGYLLSDAIALTTSANALLSYFDQTLTTSADSTLIIEDLTATLTADSILYSVNSLTFDNDAILQAFARTRDCVGNAILIDPTASVYTAVARAALNTSTGTQQITTANFGGATPKAAIQVTTYATTNNTEATHAVMSIGFTDGTDDVCITFSSEHGQSITDTVRGMTDDFMRLNLPGILAADCEAAFSSFISNGIEINLTSAPDAAYMMHLMLFGGTPVEAKVGTIITGQPGNEQDINTIGFEPDVVFFIDADRDINQEVSDNYGSFGLAYNGAAIEQRAITFEDDEGDATVNARGEYLTSYAIGKVNSYRIEVGNFDAGGFSIWTRTTGANSVAYLALKFTDKVLALSTLQTQAFSGTQELDLGINPDMLIAGLSMSSTQNTLNTTGDAFPVGFWMADGTDEYSTWMRSEDAVGTTNTASFSADSLTLHNHAGLEAYQGSLQSFDNDGLTISWTSVDATPRYWWLLLIGDSALSSVIKGCTVNGYLIRSAAHTLSASGWLSVSDLILGIGADALLSQTPSLTVTADSILSADSNTLSLSTNAYLQTSSLLTTSTNGFLDLSQGLVRFFADSILSSSELRSFSANAYLLKVNTLLADGILQSPKRTMSCSANGYILRGAGVWDTVQAPSIPDWAILKNER